MKNATKAEITLQEIVKDAMLRSIYSPGYKFRVGEYIMSLPDETRNILTTLKSSDVENVRPKGV